MKKSDTGTFMNLLEKYFTVQLPVMAKASGNTIKSYKYAFRLLFRFMNEVKGVSADHMTFKCLDRDTLAEFFKYLMTERKCSKSTAKQRLSALSAFGEYAQDRDLEAACVFKNGIKKIAKSSFKKVGHRPRAVLTRDEVEILLMTPDTATEIGFRDLTVLSVLYTSGARAQEICDLKVKDVQFFSDGRAALTLTVKGGKIRQVKISPEAASLLKKYIDHRKIGNQPQRHVFSSQTHEQMSISCVEALFRKYIASAKEKQPLLFQKSNYSPHSMRHSTATHMLEAGLPMAAVKEFLGHASIVSTQIYAELSQQKVDDYLLKWNERWFPNDQTEMMSSENTNGMPAFLT